MRTRDRRSRRNDCRPLALEPDIVKATWNLFPGSATIMELWFLVVLTVLVFVHDWVTTWWPAGTASGGSLLGRLRAGAVRFHRQGRNPLEVQRHPAGRLREDVRRGDRLASQPGRSPDQRPGKAVSFSHKTLGQRAAIVFAGPAGQFPSSRSSCWPACSWHRRPAPQDFIVVGIGGPDSVGRSRRPARMTASSAIDGPPSSDFDDLKTNRRRSARADALEIEISATIQRFTVSATPRLDFDDNFEQARSRSVPAGRARPGPRR